MSDQPLDEAPKEQENKLSPPESDPVKELAEYKDKYFRALAEIENTRKRLFREKIESQSFAIQNVILDFLQPLDHFEQALKASEGSSKEIKQWVIGFEMILTQLKQVLNDNGVSTFEVVGQPFDPHLHEAIETIHTDAFPDGTVCEECLRGYKMAGRVIRPAKVKVATASPENSK